MLMLQTVIRPSIESASMAGPRYSTTYPWPPPVPVWVIRVSTRSLAVTPAGSAPLTVTAIVFGRAWGRVWVASTCSTSLVPMPKASAPNAPWVLVWESPQTMVMPGWVSPSCGPMMCTMPWSMSPSGCSRTPNSSALRRSVSTWVRLTGSAIGLSQSSVGTLWSSVARVRSGRRTRRPARRRPSKACGEVTSWMRWRSMKRRSGSPAALRTTCSSQTFSAKVLPMSAPLRSGLPASSMSPRPNHSIGLPSTL